MATAVDMFPTIQEVRAQAPKVTAATNAEGALAVVDAMTADQADGYRLIAPAQGAITNWHFYIPTCFLSSLGIREGTRSRSIEIGDDTKVYRWVEWMQTGAFDFAKSDTIYDTPKAYDDTPWSETLQHFKRCLRVEGATQGTASVRRIDVERSSPMPSGLNARLQAVWQALPPVVVSIEDAITAVRQTTGKGVTEKSLESMRDKGGCRLIDRSTPRDPGSVVVSVWSPTADRTTHAVTERHQMSQDDFVRLLITGAIPKTAKPLTLA